MENVVETQTAGRFHTTGIVSPDVNVVWFVFHGYGMRSDEFIKSFDCIADSQTLIVAPEGLHRFYSRGTRGQIGASWMTSDLRESDIKYTIQFLNSILSSLIKNGLSNNIKIGILGFSQGVPTAIRWASQLDAKVSDIVVWGSNMPDDVIKDFVLLKKINESNIKLIIGSNDEYFPEDKVDELIMYLHDVGVNYDFHTFEGKHELHHDSIRYFHARLIDEKLEY